MSDAQTTSGDNSTSQNSFALLPRPAYQLRSLPVEFRWEVTRRHPYYLAWWSAAGELHEAASVEDPVRQSLRLAAVAILAAIGVSGPPIAPDSAFSDMGGNELERMGMAGLVHPVSNRGLIGLLIATLPKPTLAQLGMQLMQSFAREGDVDEQRIQALLQLTERQDPGLDEFVDEFIVSVAPTASQKAIAEDLATQLDRWRHRRGVSERRDRADKYPEYLDVWDRREGWIDGDGRYDNAQEKRLSDVAVELGVELSTVSNRYRRAFELITGHAYAPDLWFRVFGLDKWSDQLTDVIGDVSRRRPQRSPVPRDVPDSVVTPGDVSHSLINTHSVEDDQTAVAELLTDIRTLVAAGRSDEHVRDELELRGTDLVRAIRERLEQP